MKTFKIVRSIDPDGRAIVRVPLNGKGCATLYEKDFTVLIDLGLSLAWNRLPQGYVTAAAYLASGRSIQVGRVLLDAGANQRVRYIDGDLTNLRSNNIILLDGGSATRRDRDFISQRREIEHV